MVRRLLISAFLVCLPLSSFGFAQVATIDDVSREATGLEAELGKYKATSAQAGHTMAALVDLYYQNGRVFGLIRVAQKFVAAHPSDSRHKDIMLKLIHGFRVTSRNEDFVAVCRQFLTRYCSAPQCAAVEVRLARTPDSACWLIRTSRTATRQKASHF